MVKSIFERFKKKDEGSGDWDNLRQVEFSGEQKNEIDEEDKRQQDKLTAAFLYGKMSLAERSVNVTDAERQMVIEKMADGEIGEKEERDILSSIQSPLQKHGVEGVYGKISQEKHLSRILAYMSGNGFANWQNVEKNWVSDFADRYATPMDFESDSQDFLSLIKRQNTLEKYQEYEEAMIDFKKAIFGKRQEYWEQMKQLDGKADILRAERGEDGAESLEGPVKSVGFFEMSRTQARAGAVLVGQERLPLDYTEDAHLELPEKGVFAVFDGAGGHNNERGGARIASQRAVRKLAEITQRQEFGDEKELARAMDEVSRAISSDSDAGVSTGVAVKIIKNAEGGGKMLFASVGDSRIYLVRRGYIAYQVTKDEGFGNKITNALGNMGNGIQDEGRTKQYGAIEVAAGDRIVLCSDGITGDRPEELMSDELLGSIVNLAETTDEAARNLVAGAQKKDDRVAVVVEF